MSVADVVSGPLAALGICLLILLEEAGLPLPMFPGDALLIAAGIMITAGSASPVWFLPLAYSAAIVGALIAYGWSRKHGSTGIERIAKRLNMERPFGRIRTWLQKAGTGGVIAGKLIPGTRVYTNLVAGASRMALRDFILGLLPSTAIWVVVFTTLGMVVGSRVLSYFRHVEALAILFVVQLIITAAVLYGSRRARWLAVRRPQNPNSLGISLATDLFVILGIVLFGHWVMVPRGLGATLLTGLAAVLYTLAVRTLFGTTAGERLGGFRYGQRRVAAPQVSAT